MIRMSTTDRQIDALTSPRILPSPYPARQIAGYTVDTMCCTSWRHDAIFSENPSPVFDRGLQVTPRRARLRLPVARVKHRVLKTEDNLSLAATARNGRRCRAFSLPLDGVNSFTLVDNLSARFDTCGWYKYTKPKSTKKEFLQLPRHNNIRRGTVPHYTNFVKRVELGLRDRTPSPPPRRRIAFEDESGKRHSPSLESSSSADEEEGELVLSEEEDDEDEIEEDVSIRIPTPIEPPPDDGPEEPPSEEGREAWTQPKAPTPSPALSGRNSPELDVPETSPVDEPEEPPPPREQSPPPRDPTPPLREPTPPPSESTPPPREPTPPPREPTPPPREPTPPPEPKPKKEVRIQETPVPPPAKPKTVPQTPEKKTKSCLAKKPEVPKDVQPQPKPPTPEPAPKVVEEVATQMEDKRTEIPPLATEEESTEDAQTVQDAAQEEPGEPEPEQTGDLEKLAPETEDKLEKKKLGPPPKYKVDLFGVDSQAMKDLLDMEMRMRRKGPGSHVSDTESAPPDIPEHLLRRRQPWQQGRLALSRRACRFELPMDVHLLENMSPTEYLQKYCIVSKRRQAMYRRAFSKVDRSNSMKINKKEFNIAVLEALVDTVNTDQIQDALQLLEADNFTQFGPKLFCAICSLLERLHYSDYVTEDTIDQESLVAKERVEDADFLALDWKLDGCVINPSLKRLLYML
ncbi:translation initiation factor IF-2-like isoform X2 [Acanthaster planci]|uniref:Translation initiation factor IF-2-like isoform X2 n=1 Tax=Acanthaster planci TaxID=133434 RepID=A0A8B7ZKK8_ACAPL|nr:translation initiation factor IF-2-like isoform X2 [Acanthaster planci]